MNKENGFLDEDIIGDALEDEILEDDEFVAEKETEKLIISNNVFDNLVGEKESKITVKNETEKRLELRGIISTELANKTKNMKLFGSTDGKQIKQVERWIDNIIEETKSDLPRRILRDLRKEMLLEIVGYGKIHHLMEMDDVTEVMINGPKEVWIEKKGKLILSDVKFYDEEEVYALANKIASNVGRSVNNSNPILDARLPDGSRVHIVIPPIALKGTTITIRKFFKEKLKIEDLIGFGSISEEAAKFIKDAVEAKANIIVSGGTGSGKTTTLNVVSNFVPNHERIITVEDSAELQPNNEHVSPLESRNANNEGKGAVTIRDLVKATLRMRPDRIVIGEIRDGTAFDLMQAMNTGHDGTMATVHSNDPDSCVDRMDSLCQMADDVKMTSSVLRKMIGQGVDIIVQIARLPDGSRKITHISEVMFDHKLGETVTHPIYLFEATGKDEEGKILGEFKFTGYVVSNNLQSKFLIQGNNYFESVGLKEI